MDMTTTSKHCLAAVGAIMGWILSLPHAVWLLFILQVIDIVTGFMRAYNTGKLCSDICWKGMSKKIGMWLLVGMAYAIEHCSHVDIPLGDMSAFYYCVVEGLSIFENTGNLGLPIPPILRNSLKGLSEEEKADEEDNKRDDEPLKDEDEEPSEKEKTDASDD